MGVARYIHFQSSRGLYTICTEPANNPRYKERVWARFAPAGDDLGDFRRLYESRDQALVATGMLIEQMEREGR